MTLLSQLTRVVAKRKPRVGRGYGSGKGGHTSTRGTKGHKARGRVSIIFTGTKHKKSLWQRLPVLRGRRRLKSNRPKVTITLEMINQCQPKTGQVVDKQFLMDHKLISRQEARRAVIKVVAKGSLKVPIKLKLPASQQVKSIIDSLELKNKPNTTSRKAAGSKK